jgi:hypothetical protein
VGPLRTNHLRALGLLGLRNRLRNRMAKVRR